MSNYQNHTSHFSFTTRISRIVFLMCGSTIRISNRQDVSTILSMSFVCTKSNKTNYNKNSNSEKINKTSEQVRESNMYYNLAARTNIFRTVDIVRERYMVVRLGHNMCRCTASSCDRRGFDTSKIRTEFFS